MDLMLKNKVAIVTGASRGIGRAIALALAEEGVHLALCARTPEPLEAVKKECARCGVDVVTLPVDVTRPDEVHSFVSWVKNRFNHVDILVNNVGSAQRHKDFWDRTEEDWIEGLKTNLVSTVSLCRQVVPLMKKPGIPLSVPSSMSGHVPLQPQTLTRGKIINIASNWGLLPQAVAPEYGAAKAGLIYYTRSLALACAKEGIQVNAVAPGPVRTPALEAVAQDRARENDSSLGETLSEADRIDRFFERLGQEVLCGRVGTPVEVAKLVVYLVSPWANWITGSCFVIDGGALKSIV